ncbi:MAG TPA: four helix bundle protein [Ferruginibacter sp.]|jgi:four helix bundle protein|nr:four helix bundle protein [Chitinophagales bacterium]HNA15356.1 four helix bundle protein [Ferruginibacter sp.]HNF03587.1 four helix bundle protein [Ferruginibacter sp.]HNG63816.1 four helix bundle protein [Ferruginibacter sp.]HNH22191.1 four helix bundle protein [Ferruginibacter sp.]
MATIKRFEDLDVWKVSRDLCDRLGVIIDSDALKRNFRLIGQIEGSSGSVMDNIAEGFERGTKAEFILFLGYSKGSCGELRSQLYRALDRKYINKEQFQELYLLAVRISVMLQKFINYLLQSQVKGLRKKNPETA